MQMKIRWVCKRYRRKTVLKDVGLSACSGECVGILGGNGLYVPSWQGYRRKRKNNRLNATALRISNVLQMLAAFDCNDCHLPRLF